MFRFVSEESNVGGLQTRFGGPKLTILVAKLVRRPDAALAGRAMHGIHKPKALSLTGIGAVVVGIAQETGRHAGPEGEDDESQQIAGGHGAAAGLVQGGAGRVPANVLVAAELGGDGAALAGGGDEVEDDEEEDGARDVDEGVDAVDPVHHGGHL